MKLLESELSKNGFTYKLVERNEFKAIYSQWDGGRIVGFEVFKVKKQKATTLILSGNTIYLEAKETYPNNEDFGKRAWAYKTLAQAVKKYHEISKSEAKNG